jgi:hypothetical protein
MVALALLAGCAVKAPVQPAPVNIGALAAPAPAPEPAAPPPAASPAAVQLSAEQLADDCQVVSVENEEGSTRADVARVECQPPAGTPGAECLRAALFAASTAGIARNRLWFVYRISPAEDVPAGRFHIAVVYLEDAQAYARGRGANTDPTFVFTSAEEVLPAETFLMQISQVDKTIATAPSEDDPFAPTAGDEPTD